ncbi:hypothetical protein CRG98_036570 [Punica granatum]|nr:hypothetical protein CRG98_036570 [Punica granatum]
MSELQQLHAHTIKLGLSTDTDTMGQIIKFCSASKNGDLEYALKVFDGIPNPDVFLYNILMKGFWRMASRPRDAIVLYLRMLHDAITPNSFTFPCVIRACCVDSAVREGRQVHAQVLKFGFGEDVVSSNNLIHMYVNFLSLEEARRVFDKMPSRSVVSCTTMITGYARSGFVDEALEVFESIPEKSSVLWNSMVAAFVQTGHFHGAFALFERMLDEKVVLDKFIAATVLSACAGSGALGLGKWIHFYIQSNEIELDPKLASAIIDMYCKCGCLEKALEIFNGLPSKGLSAWNSMIGGLAVHGKGDAAVKLFMEMEKEKVAPDHITFLNVLTACAHSGLIEEANNYFEHMMDFYGIKPRIEHFGCMVDLFGRAGMINEAMEIIEGMPMTPDASVLGALLGACRVHGKVELGERIGMEAIDLDPSNSGRYVLLANLYASAGKWQDVAEVRKLMNDREVEKIPGFSAIELDGNISKFVAGDRNHPESELIYAKVDAVLESIRKVGYEPDINEVLHDLSGEDIETPLCYHSEKLAIGFGLLKSKPGETIRIYKNLRICRDCHCAAKLISEVFSREIIMRDRSRFHHFRSGECSCKDSW